MLESLVSAWAFVNFVGCNDHKENGQPGWWGYLNNQCSPEMLIQKFDSWIENVGIFLAFRDYSRWLAMVRPVVDARVEVAREEGILTLTGVC